MTSTISYDITRTDHAAVESFIERLAAFGLDEWLSVAAAYDPNDTETTASLEALICRHGLNVEAWSVVDDVETAVHYSLGSRGFAPSGEGASLRLARQAAIDAARALLVHSVLPAGAFERLYRPFASLVALAPDPPRPASLVEAAVHPPQKRLRLA